MGGSWAAAEFCRFRQFAWGLKGANWSKTGENRVITCCAYQEQEPTMSKLGIVGVGAVGCACALSCVTRGSAREVVLVDRTRKRAEAVATDLRYGTPLTPKVTIADGDYGDLAGCGVVMITAGVNEKTGGATDRSDPQGRLRLLDQNAAIYRDIVPRVARAAPQAVILVVTDPPDPLADVARECAGHDRVLSTGTLLDSQRFRVHLARHFAVDAATVEAQVIGDHGTAQVFLWSSARIGGVPVEKLVADRGEDLAALRRQLEQDVRYANITIIEGNNASQFGIGIVSARIAEMVLADERAVVPIGSYNRRYGVTLSLPSVVGRDGVSRILEPDLTAQESEALDKSAETLRNALRRVQQEAA
jgi:L-lactate dehydrogenase